MATFVILLLFAETTTANGTSALLSSVFQQAVWPQRVAVIIVKAVEIIFYLYFQSQRWQAYRKSPFHLAPHFHTVMGRTMLPSPI